MATATALITLALVAGGAFLMGAGNADAGAASRSTEDVFRWWDPVNPVGRSALVRTGSGLTAIFRSGDLPPGQAITLWFIIFNRPDQCATSPCSLPADVFNDAAEADFHWATGRVTGSSGMSTFAAHLAVGDTNGSGKEEIGLGPAVPLTNPAGAEVVLALHSHGPKATGQDLKLQLTSFTGGCLVFNGPDGFAAGEEDVPDEFGECSTFQRSLHQAE